ncbi:hypothetical protein O6P43_035946, partial [Quillaja saponaria]
IIPNPWKYESASSKGHRGRGKKGLLASSKATNSLNSSSMATIFDHSERNYRGTDSQRHPQSLQPSTTSTPTRVLLLPSLLAFPSCSLSLSSGCLLLCFLSPSSFDRFVALLGCVDSLNTRVELPWISPILGHNQPITSNKRQRSKSRSSSLMLPTRAFNPGKTSLTHTISSPPSRLAIPNVAFLTSEFPHLCSLILSLEMRVPSIDIYHRIWNPPMDEKVELKTPLAFFRKEAYLESSAIYG